MNRTEGFLLLSLRMFIFPPSPVYVFSGSPKKRHLIHSAEHLPFCEFRIGVSNRPLKFLTSSVMQAGFIQCSLQSPRPAWPLLALLLCGIRQLRSRAVRVERILQLFHPMRPLLGPLAGSTRWLCPPPLTAVRCLTSFLSELFTGESEEDGNGFNPLRHSVFSRRSPSR